MDIFNPAGPFAGIPDALKPNPPANMPEAPGAGNAMEGMSPFNEPLDADQIIANLMLDRPLKLFIPNRHLYPDHEFRIINSIPQEIADAHNKGWKEVSDPKLCALFTDLVAGTDKNGKAFRPILCARPKQVGDHVRKRNRLTLSSLYAGMDPRQRDFGTSRAENVTTGPDASKGSFSGPAFRIRV